MAAGLALLTLGLSCSGPSPRPNVILIVVDTLRADHTSLYGYDRPTTPRIDELLGDHGVVVENAYVEAPWTLPSMASMLTGLPASDLTDAAGSPVGIPDTAVTLAEILAEGGYTTAAVVANPTMHAGNGFAQGFSHFLAAPPELASLTTRHADAVDVDVLSYLAAGPEEPFFLWAHFIDPHDPYLSPDLENGRSPFDPDYDGPIEGDDIHGLEVGAVTMEDPKRDLRHIAALYDSEIRFVDRAIGRLLDALGPEVLERSLVILTSDHGEELYDHGGFKHGQTLYQEQLRVPFVVRWDGEIPASRRLAGPVRMLDLLPTVVSAARLRPPEGLPGIDLLPALRGDERAARQMAARSIFVRHLGVGPERAAVLRAGEKAILFDRNATRPEDPSRREADLDRIDSARMRRFERYDLEADPKERSDLGADLGQLDAAEDDEAAIGARQVLCGLDPWLGGIRVVRPPSADTTTVRLRFAPLGKSSGPIEIRGLFLGPDDEATVEGREVSLLLAADEIPKGVLLNGALSSLESIDVRVDDEVALLQPDTSDGVGLRTLLADGCPLVDWGEGPEPALHLWLRAKRAPFAVDAVDDETLERLKALNYI